MQTFVRTCALIGAAIAMASAAHGCRDATQVTLILGTSPKISCGALHGIQIAVAGSSGKAEDGATGEFLTASASCPNPAAQQIGTLVVTPGGSGNMAVVVVAGIRNDARSCKPVNRYDGCVVARRSLSFREHVSVTVPILIDPSCVDVPCDVSTTCHRGACIPSAVECADDGSCASVDPRGREDEDAGSSPTDASSDVPAQGDAPMSDGPADDASVADSGADADDGGSGSGLCKAYCSEGNGPCPTNVCCYTTSDTNDPVQVCETPAECMAGGNGRMPNGVAECCRGSSDCGAGQLCCLTAGKQTVCRTACNVGENQICMKSTECPAGKNCSAASIGGMAAMLSTCL